MNRIDLMFADKKNTEETALIGFVTAGDPDPAQSRSIIREMIANGLDLLELGIPFSDPTADGPAIQDASMRALSAGMNVKSAIRMVADIRTDSDIPVVLFSYLNPVLAYGAERFARDAAGAGVDGVLIVDMPPEEDGDLLPHLTSHQIRLIRLVAPTTPDARLSAIGKKAEGFLYLVSMTGVTGTKGIDPTAVSQLAAHVASRSRVPVAVGFGISTPDHVAALSPFTDGIVIGSAFVRAIAENLRAPDLATRIGTMVAAFKKNCLPKKQPAA